MGAKQPKQQAPQNNQGEKTSQMQQIGTDLKDKPIQQTINTKFKESSRSPNKKNNVRNKTTPISERKNEITKDKRRKYFSKSKKQERLVISTMTQNKQKVQTHNLNKPHQKRGFQRYSVYLPELPRIKVSKTTNLCKGDLVSTSHAMPSLDNHIEIECTKKTAAPKNKRHKKKVKTVSQQKSKPKFRQSIKVYIKKH